MPHTINLAEHQLVALSRRTLATLRAALFRDSGPSATTYLQEAGYAGGETVYASFRDWLAARGGPEPEELGVEEFQQQASAYFREAGWGTISVGSLNEAVVAIDSDDWGEADAESRLEHPGCHLTTGMFADFFGRISDLSLAVLEVECRSMGAPRCRFLLGNSEVMHFLYGEMERGGGYEEAVEKVE
jgi:predicted hydrocarbon binding protein